MIAPTPWNPEQLPDQLGKTFVVTGGNAGIGYFAAEQLARTGGHVVIASRNPGRASLAQQAIRTRVPDASTGFVRFDLASLTSMKEAAADLSELPRLDAVVLNAGAMSAPEKGETTRDGFPPPGQEWSFLSAASSRGTGTVRRRASARVSRKTA